MTSNDIINAVAKSWGIRPQDILGKSKLRKIASAKHYCRFLLGSELGWSSNRIAKLCGCTHSNILYSFKQVDNWMSQKDLPEHDNIAKVKLLLKGGAA